MPESNLSFWEHLDELRSVILKSLSAWLIASLAAFFFKKQLFACLFAPTQSRFILYRALFYLAQITGWEAMRPDGVEVHFLNTELTAQFMTHIQVSLFTGLIIAMPLVVFWLYEFVAPAVGEQTKRVSTTLLLGSVLLFAAGVCLNYFLIFPLSFRFLVTYQVTSLVVNQISLSSYISLFLVMSLLMGLFFELPLMTWILSRMGILNREVLMRYRKHVFLAILILAAVITPTGDPFTLLLVTVPVYLLYELSIHIIK